MLQQHVSTSRRIQALMPTVQRVVEFFTTSTYARRGQETGACDFALGNPHDMPIPALGYALQRWSQPQAPNWFAYQMSELPGREAVAASLSRRLGMSMDPHDIALTTGAFAGLSVALTALVDPGDEVIFITPPWFFYETLIAAAGAVPVPVFLSSSAWATTCTCPRGRTTCSRARHWRMTSRSPSS